VKVTHGADGSATDVSTASPLPVTLANTGANATAVKVDGSAATQPVSGTVTANAGTNLNTSSLALESGGNLAAVAGAVISQEATTSGVKGITAFGAVTTAKPTYTTAKSDALSLDTNGLLRVSLADTPANGNAFPVKGTGVAGLAGTDVMTVQGIASMIALKTDGSGVTQPVSAASLPLPSGASTSAKQPALGTAGTPSADVITVQGVTSMIALKVDGSGVTQPISAASLPLPALAATSTKQSDGTQKTQIVDGSGNVIGATSNAIDVNIKSGASSGTQYTEDAAAAADPVGNMLIARRKDTLSTSEVSADGDNIALNSTNKGQLHVKLADTVTVDGSGVTQPISGTVTANAGTGTMAVSLASVPSHAVTNAGTFAVQAASAGDVAHDGADSGNPVKVGGKATNVEPAAVSASGDRTNFITDMVGKQITLPYSNPENFVSGAITTAMTGTTSTSLVAAPGAGLRNYITTIIVSNAHATVGTDVIIQDGSGGTTLLTIPAAAAYGGAAIPLPTPLRQPTANTALFCANVTTGASTKLSAVGYKGA
jgi:hypothetical protein